VPTRERPIKKGGKDAGAQKENWGLPIGPPGNDVIGQKRSLLRKGNQKTKGGGGRANYGLRRELGNQLGGTRISVKE